MQLPVTSHDIPLARSVGIGVAYYPRDRANALELLRAAISGAHESQDSMKSWCAYRATLDRAAQRSAQLLRDIGPALANEGNFISSTSPRRTSGPGAAPVPKLFFVGLIPPWEQWARASSWSSSSGAHWCMH
jgi:hypothetical protein